MIVLHYSGKLTVFLISCGKTPQTLVRDRLGFGILCFSVLWIEERLGLYRDYDVLSTVGIDGLVTTITGLFTAW